MLFLLPALIGGIASTTATTIGTAVGAATVAAGSATAAVGSAAAAVGSAAAAVGSAATTAATAVGGALGSIGATGGMSAVTKGVMGTVAKVAAVTATKKTSVDTVVQTVAMVAGALVGDKLVGKKRKQKDLPFMDVNPRRGSILKVDLAGGVAEHTGVYLGDGRIAEVTDVDGDAVVRVVDPDEFVSGDGLVRTGLHAYVACEEDGMSVRPLAADSVARRAESAVGDRGAYNLVFNNCHMFTRYCITGDSDGTPCLSVDAIESALKERYDVGSVVWCKAAGAAFA